MMDRTLRWDWREMVIPLALTIVVISGAILFIFG